MAEKQKAIDALETSVNEAMEKVKDNLKKDATEHQKLSAKKTIETLRENLVIDKDQTEEIYKTVLSMAKRIVPGTVMSEDEFLKLEEYGAVDHLTVGMGAESILSYLEGLDIQKLSREIRESRETMVAVDNYIQNLQS